jgi:DNA-binding NarL/FixJ family response regulator
MYRVVIVDEDDDDISRLQLYVHKNDREKKFTVIPITPKPSFEETLEEILSSNLDAIVSDYRLNEYKANITYDGISLVNAILERKADFPCFVLTSFDDDAVKDSEDVNIVYIKGIMNGESNAKITFLERIERQIQKHQYRINESVAKLDELIAIKQTRTLDAKEEDQFVELSHFLDKAIVGNDSIPRVFYSNDTNSKLDEIINKTDELLKMINPQNDDNTL